MLTLFHRASFIKKEDEAPTALQFESTCAWDSATKVYFHEHSPLLLMSALLLKSKYTNGTS